MGTWGNEPWDNDAASEWFDAFMIQTNIRGYVMETVEQEYEEGYYYQLDVIRAAISVFIMLGRTYTWPIETLEDDLSKVLARAREIQVILANNPEHAIPLLEKEISILEGRLHKVQAMNWPWGMGN